MRVLILALVNTAIILTGGFTGWINFWIGVIYFAILCYLDRNDKGDCAW